MVKDFMNIASHVRSITYNRKNSFEDFGLLIEDSTEEPNDTPITKYVTVPFMDGFYDFTEIGGKVNYQNKQWSYTFLLVGDNDRELKERAAEVRAWLSVYGNGELKDTDYSGWKYVKARYLGSSINMEKRGNLVRLLMKVDFIAAPFMQTTAGKLIEMATFTPSLTTENYIYDVYATSSPIAVGYLASTTSVPGSSFISGSDISVSSYSANATVSLSESKSWLAFLKSYSGIGYTVTAVSNCDVIGSATDSSGKEYWIIRAKSTSVTVKVEGRDSVHPVSGTTCKTAILNSYWRKSSSYVSWLSASVPDTNHMRIVSEGDPTLKINNVSADVNQFTMAAGNILTLSGVKSTACKLQYYTIRERR